jgi:hypothetical protein
MNAGRTLPGDHRLPKLAPKWEVRCRPRGKLFRFSPMELRDCSLIIGLSARLVQYKLQSFLDCSHRSHVELLQNLVRHLG